MIRSAPASGSRRCQKINRVVGDALHKLLEPLLALEQLGLSRSLLRQIARDLGVAEQFAAPVPPLRVIGSDSHGMKDWFATWRGQIGYEIRDLQITAGDDGAFCHALVNLTGKRTDGSESDVWFRNTLCLSKTDEVWKIVHGHESVPMYLDGSFKAAIDLKPYPERAAAMRANHAS